MIRTERSEGEDAPAREFNVSADEIIEELMERVAQLTMEISAKNIIIRKLEAFVNEQE